MNKLSVPYAALGAAYCVLLLLDTLLEVKIINVYGLELTLGTAVIALVYVCSDCLVEVYGFARARLLMWLGFFLLGFSTLVLNAACYVPSIPGWEGNEHFNYLYNMSPRIALACLAAYIFGSYTNNFVMSKLKVLWKGKYFKSRAMISTVAGETVDAIVGTFGIFFGILPLTQVLTITFSMALVKCCIEALVLPVTSRLVRYLKKEEEKFGDDSHASYKLFSMRQE